MRTYCSNPAQICIKCAHGTRAQRQWQVCDDWRSYKEYTKICQVLPWSDMMYKAASHSMDKPSTILVIKIPHWSISRNIQQSVHHWDCFVTAPARRSCGHTAEIQHKICIKYAHRTKAQRQGQVCDDRRSYRNIQKEVKSYHQNEVYNMM